MGNERVGVNVIEGTSSSPVEGVSTAVSGIIGVFERGPLNKATLVTTMAQFERTFGSKPAPGSTSYYSVKAFFQTVGSGSLYIIRVASAAALKAYANFVDRQGSPANTLKIEATSQGIWGNNISCKILDYSILSTKPATNISGGATKAKLLTTEGLEVGSDLKLYNGTQTEYRRLTAVDHANAEVTWSGGLTNAYTTVNGIMTSVEFAIEVYVGNVLTESFTGLGMNNATSFHVARKVKSEFIAVIDLKSSDTAYTDLPVATATPTAFTSGADGLSNIVASDYVGSQAAKTGVFAFDTAPDLFRFACPNPLLTDGSPDTAYESLVQSLLDYANIRGTVQFYGDIPFAKTPTTARTFADKFAGRRICLFWPWLKVIEKGLDVWLPPSTFVIGCAVKKDYERGVFVNVGNRPVAYGIDLEYHVGDVEGNTLNDGLINCLRAFPGEGILIYGGRTKATTTQNRFLNWSEYWNYVARTIERNTRDIVFQPNDVNLWKTVTRRLTAFLENEQLKGALSDPNNPTGRAFQVIMNATNNPADQVALGIARVQVEYVPTGVAEKVVVELTSSPTGLQITSVAA